MPPLLTVDHPVRNNDMQRVIPDSACQLEGDVVLGEVGSRFGRIPFELHAASLYVHNCTYNTAGQVGFRNWIAAPKPQYEDGVRRSCQDRRPALFPPDERPP